MDREKNPNHTLPQNPSVSSNKVLERKKCANPNCTDYFYATKGQHRKYCEKHRPKKPKPSESPSITCLRCREVIKTNFLRALCEKCDILLKALYKASMIKFLRKGAYAVWFEGCHAWILQPRALALHNKQLGKDVFCLADLTLEKCEKWILSKNALMEIFYSEEN